MDYQTSGNASLYGAFGDYEKSVRDRKFQTSVVEDEISHLKSTLEQAVANNQQLKNRCENMKLQHEKEEALFQTELKKKQECEVEIESLLQKCEERSLSVKKKQALRERIKQSHESNTDTLKKANDNFLIRYKTIPSVAEYLDATDNLKALEGEHNETLNQVNEYRVSMIKFNKQTESEWLILQNACIKMANLSKRSREIESQVETMKLMDLALTNVEAMEQVATTGDTSTALQLDNAATILPKADGNANVVNKGSRGTREGEPKETVGHLEKRLQQLRTRCSSFVPKNTADRSSASAKPSPSGLIGIKRYLNAKDELAVRRGRNVQEQTALECGDNQFQKHVKNNPERSSKLGKDILNVGSTEGVVQKNLQQFKLKFLEGTEKPSSNSCSEEVMDITVSTKEINTVPKPSNLMEITQPLKSPSATDVLPKNQTANQGELCGSENENYTWSSHTELILQSVDSTPKQASANCIVDNRENIPSLNEILRKYQDPASKDIFKKPLPPKVVQPKHVAIDMEWSGEEQQHDDHVRAEDNFLNSKSIGLEPFPTSSSSGTSGLMDIFGNGTTTPLNDKPAAENDGSVSGDSAFSLDNFFSNCASNQPLF